MFSRNVQRMLVMNRVGVGLTRSTINPMLTCNSQVKGAKKYRPHDREPPVARTGQHPFLRPGWAILLHKHQISLPFPL